MKGMTLSERGFWDNADFILRESLFKKMAFLK